jgi:hypothetical protein
MKLSSNYSSKKVTMHFQNPTYQQPIFSTIRDAKAGAGCSIIKLFPSNYIFVIA